MTAQRAARPMFGRRQSLISVPIVAVSLALWGCGGDTPSAPVAGSGSTPVPQTGPLAFITVIAPERGITHCRHLQLSARGMDSQGRPVPLPALTWSSSLPLVASVSSTGGVTGLSEGPPVIITASTENVSGYRQFIVYPRNVGFWFVDVHPDTVGLNVGERMQLTSVQWANDQINTLPVKWETATPGIASVSADGVVTAHSPGESAILAVFVEPDDGNDLSVCPARTFIGSAIVKVRPKP